MNKHYSLLLLGYFCLLFTSKSTACGYAWVSDCSSQVHLRINGTLDSFNIADCPSGYGFDGIHLGNLQSLTLANAKMITWESCQNNVFGGQLHYRVYEQGFPGGNWLSLNLQEYHQTIEGPYTTRYSSAPTNISLTNGLTEGKTYTVEVYLQAAVDTIGDDFIPETSILRNNNGANYKLTFTYGGPAAPPITLLPHLSEPTCHGDNDGKISVSAYGDLTGVYYYWSNINLDFFAQYNLTAGTYTITVTNSAGGSTVETMQLGEPTMLQTTFSNVQSVGCNNSPGAATVSPTGGTAPYTFLWGNGQQTSTVAFPQSGNWQVTVTDAHHCSATGSVTIGNTGQVEESLSAEICAGEAYHIGNQYLTTPGLYTFTLPGIGGCDTLLQLTIHVLDPTLALATLPNSISLTCNQPATNLCVTPLDNTTYQWWKDGVATTNTPCLLATAGGNYTVEATVMGANHVCSAAKNIHSEAHFSMEPVQITGNFTLTCTAVAPSGWLVAHTDAIDPAFSWEFNGVVLSTDDSCFFTITEWTGGTTPVLPNLTVTDTFGCQNSLPILYLNIAVQQDLPTITVSATDATAPTANNGTANVDIFGSHIPYLILWSNGATTPDITNLAPGTYCVTVTGSNGCMTTGCVEVHFPLSIEHVEADLIKISPNPAAPGATVTVGIPQELQGENVRITLTDLNGVVIYSGQTGVLNGSSFQLAIPVLIQSGVTFVRLTTRSKSFSIKLLVQY